MKTFRNDSHTLALVIGLIVAAFLLGAAAACFALVVTVPAQNTVTITARDALGHVTTGTAQLNSMTYALGALSIDYTYSGLKCDGFEAPPACVQP